MSVRFPPHVRRTSLLLATIAASAAGCGSAVPGAGPLAPQPTIDLAVAGAPVALEVGRSAQTALTVSRTGGFRGPVTLVVDSAPAGVFATFSPASIEADGTQSTLTVTAGAGATPGTYRLTVSGTAAGVRTASTPVAVTVLSSAGPQAAVSMVAPAGVSMARGGSVAVPLTAARTEYRGELALTAEELPSGVTATFSPATLSGTAGASTLTLTATSDAAGGTRTITVRARGEGVSDAVARIAVTVAQASTPAASLDGIYLGLRTNIDGKVYQDFWTFLPDGRVMNVDPYEGLGRPVDLAYMCARYSCGSYVRQGAELRIRWDQSTQERVYDLDAAGAFNERGKVQKYRPLAPLTGLRLAATYAVIDRDRDVTFVRLQLAADGRFSEQSLMSYTAWTQLALPGEQRVARPGGSGTYTIDRNTLALRYDDGQVAYFTVVVPPGEAGKSVPDALYVNTANLPRIP